jgi:hypothetical protein
MWHMLCWIPWEEMTKLWRLPLDEDLLNPSSNWFQALTTRIPDHMIDTTLHVAWRAWYLMNKVINDNPLPSIERVSMYSL